MEQAREKGQRWVISTREEMRQAVIDVAREANRKISIFTHDLEPGIYDDPDFLEVIKRFILSQAYSRIRVLIADPTRAIKNGNNFVHLGRRLNTYIEFRHVREPIPTNRPWPDCTARCSTSSGPPAK
jgi:ABC-type taurine transport system ATPase subunit